MAAMAATSMVMLTACSSIASGSGASRQDFSKGQGQGTRGIAGQVRCESGDAVVGLWVAAQEAKDSHFADWKSLDGASTAQWWTNLPNGETYSLHVGCGGSRQRWQGSLASDTIMGDYSLLDCDDKGDQAQSCAKLPATNDGNLPPESNPAPAQIPIAQPGSDPHLTSESNAFTWASTNYAGAETTIPLPSPDETSTSGIHTDVAINSVINHTNRTLCGRNFEDSDPSLKYAFAPGAAWNTVGVPFSQEHPLDFFFWC